MQVPPPVVYVPVPASGWQIGSTVATASAAIIALIVAVTSLVQRRNDRLRDEQREVDAARAEARLVVCFGAPVVKPLESDPTRTGFTFPITNDSGTPLLHLRPEVWTGYIPQEGPDEPSTLQAVTLMPGRSQTFQIAVEADATGNPPSLRAWRVRWSDPKGNQWFHDHHPPGDPEIFTGQKPRPY